LDKDELGNHCGGRDTGRHYIVKYEDGRKAWIKKEEILFGLKKDPP